MSDGLFIRCFTGTAAGAYLSGLPAEVVLGAFGGALIFTVSATEYSTLRRVVLALASFVCGISMYHPVTGMIHAWLPFTREGQMADAISAFVVSCIAVKVGCWLYRRSNDPGKFLKGGKDV